MIMIGHIDSFNMDKFDLEFDAYNETIITYKDLEYCLFTNIDLFGLVTEKRGFIKKIVIDKLDNSISLYDDHNRVSKIILGTEKIKTDNFIVNIYFTPSGSSCGIINLKVTKILQTRGEQSCN